ncbi:unnamed protein product [Adineta steineri]|nr:unnamed protein product [Adineta steineri]
MQGRGTKTWISRGKYIGDWVNDTITGQGTYRWLNGDKYTGDFVNDTRTGNGTYTWSNGNNLPRSSTDHTVTSLKQLRNVFTSTNRSTGAITQSILLEEPNPPCIQCGDIEQRVRVGINISLFTLYSLYERLIRKHLKVNKPDVIIADDTITDEDEYIIVDDEIIGEIKQIEQSLKGKLSKHADDDGDDNIQHSYDYQDELNIVKKTKILLITHDDHDNNNSNNGPMHTSFAMRVDDQAPTYTNGHHAHQEISGNNTKVNTKNYIQTCDGKYSVSRGAGIRDRPSPKCPF